MLVLRSLLIGENTTHFFISVKIFGLRYRNSYSWIWQAYILFCAMKLFRRVTVWAVPSLGGFRENSFVCLKTLKFIQNFCWCLLHIGYSYDPHVISRKRFFEDIMFNFTSVKSRNLLEQGCQNQILRGPKSNFWKLRKAASHFKK
jgi:hypothetical protein